MEFYRRRWSGEICVKGLGPNANKAFTDLNDYMRYRNIVFGSAEAYWRFALEADQEFVANQGKLRRILVNPYEKKS